MLHGYEKSKTKDHYVKPSDHCKTASYHALVVWLSLTPG